MNKGEFLKYRVLPAVILLTLLLSSAGTAGVQNVLAQDGPPPPEVEEVNEWFTTVTYTLEDGTELVRAVINGPPAPPVGSDALGLTLEPLPSEGVIANMPAYSWVFGCSAVSGAMIAGYYDRSGYPNMYAGPTNNGVMSRTDTNWPTWTDSEPATYPNNPLVASHKGVDGRPGKLKGSIDDYWVMYKSIADDPYITGGWTEHTWGGAIGDYMKTSQSAWPNNNVDGATSFWTLNSNVRLTCSAMESMTVDGIPVAEDDGTYGRKEFYEARGYTVTECWNQRTYNKNEGGFSLADLQAQIDAGHPVLINVVGHSMVAYGYSGKTVYIRNTWDNDPSNTYTMVWDSAPEYGGADLYSVSIVKLALAAERVPTTLEPAGTYWTNDLTYKWSVVDGATQYQYRVWDGATNMWDRTVPAVVCPSTYCKDYPEELDLIDGAYKWQVRSYVGGSWSDWSPLRWYSIKAGFNSQFTSDAAGWKPTYGAWTWDINSGNYRTNGLLSMFSTSRFDQVYGIYTYEVKLRRQGSEMSSTYGILFNGNPWPLDPLKRWNKGYGFFIRRDGYYSIFQYDGGVALPILNWTDGGDLVKPGWYNILKVTYNKNTGYTQLFINGTRVATGFYTTNKWGNVGVTMVKMSTGWEQMLVDWAVLTPSAPSSAAESDATGGIIINEADVVPGVGSDTGE